MISVYPTNTGTLRFQATNDTAIVVAIPELLCEMIPSFKSFLKDEIFHPVRPVSVIGAKKRLSFCSTVFIDDKGKPIAFLKFSTKGTKKTNLRRIDPTVSGTVSVGFDPAFLSNLNEKKIGNLFLACPSILFSPPNQERLLGTDYSSSCLVFPEYLSVSTSGSMSPVNRTLDSNWGKVVLEFLYLYLKEVFYLRRNDKEIIDSYSFLMEGVDDSDLFVSNDVKGLMLNFLAECKEIKLDLNNVFAAMTKTAQIIKAKENSPSNLRCNCDDTSYGHNWWCSPAMFREILSYNSATKLFGDSCIDSMLSSSPGRRNAISALFETILYIQTIILPLFEQAFSQIEENANSIQSFAEEIGEIAKKRKSLSLFSNS